MAQGIASLLVFFREHRNWDQPHVASKLGISLDEYKSMESGESALDRAMVEQLAEIYDTPVDCFNGHEPIIVKQADVLFTHCTFSGNNGAGYINHQYSDRGIDLILSSKNDEIKSLKEQIADLRQQNDKLVALIGKHLKDDDAL